MRSSHEPKFVCDFWLVRARKLIEWFGQRHCASVCLLRQLNRPMQLSHIAQWKRDMHRHKQTVEANWQANFAGTFVAFALMRLHDRSQLVRSHTSIELIRIDSKSKLLQWIPLQH